MYSKVLKCSSYVAQKVFRSVFSSDYNIYNLRVSRPKGFMELASIKDQNFVIYKHDLFPILWINWFTKTNIWK